MDLKDITVIICCAGMGTRLGIGTTKALIDINNKPLIYYQLELLKDFEDVRIVVGFQAEEVIKVVNMYRKDVTVTVVKEVTGNMCDPKNEFTFKVNGGPDQTVTAETDKNKIVTDVAYGSEFTVTETDKNGYVLKGITAKGSTGSQSSDSYTIDSVTADTEITFFNDKTIQPPNGITTTIAPYAIMVVLATGAGVYFVYSRRRRNR